MVRRPSRMRRHRPAGRLRRPRGKTPWAGRGRSGPAARRPGRCQARAARYSHAAPVPGGTGSWACAGSHIRSRCMATGTANDGSPSLKTRRADVADRFGILKPCRRHVSKTERGTGSMELLARNPRTRRGHATRTIASLRRRSRGLAGAGARNQRGEAGRGVPAASWAST